VTVLMVSYKVREGSMTEVESGVEKIVAALEEQRPEGVRYALGRLPDGVTVVGFLQFDDGAVNPLPGIPAARELQQKLASLVDGEAPTPQPLEVLGTYRLFG
jgi:hypothetical protein